MRTPEEAERVLSEFRGDVHTFGGKELVEGRFYDGDVLCITDDMVTDFGSKLIARRILEYEMERRGVGDVKMKHVAVVLDREQGAEDEARNQGMQLHSLIKFKSQGLGWLESIMKPEEYQLIHGYQEDPSSYQDEDVREGAIREANRIMGR